MFLFKKASFLTGSHNNTYSNFFINQHYFFTIYSMSYSRIKQNTSKSQWTEPSGQTWPKYINGHRNLLVFSVNEYYCVAQTNELIASTAKIKFICFYRWCEPTFSSFSCMQSHFCSFKFMFGKAVCFAYNGWAKKRQKEISVWIQGEAAK